MRKIKQISYAMKLLSKNPDQNSELLTLSMPVPFSLVRV